MILTHEDLKIKITSETNTHGVFEFDPLPKGFGYTLGNTFRRVLMTSMEGAAITSIKVKGANHQFSTLDGVKEDLVQLILNLKQIRFKSHTENPSIATLKVKKEGKITAADITVSSDIEVMNKDAYIATLANSKSEIEIEMIVEKGIGYSPEEERPNTKVGVIVLDAVFSPVSRVQIEVDETRSGKRVDLDKLMLTVDTDGSIKPSAAVYESAKILSQFFKKISQWELAPEKIESEEASSSEAVSPVANQMHDISIEDLPLQTRTINALKKHGISTMEELSKKTDDELNEIKNLGEKSVKEIINLLSEEGLR